MKIGRKLNTALFAVIIGFLIAAAFLSSSVFRFSELKELEIQALRVINDINGLNVATKTLLANSSMTLQERVSGWKQTEAVFERSLGMMIESAERYRLSPVLGEQLKKTVAVWELTRKKFAETETLLSEIREKPVLDMLETQGILRGTVIMSTNRTEAYPVGTLHALNTIQMNLENLDIAGGSLVVKNLQIVAEDLRNEGERSTRTSFIVSSLIAGMIILCAIIFSMRFSRNFSRRIRVLESTMRRVSDRDLTVRANVRGRDEVAALGDYIDTVLITMNGFMVLVQKAANKAGILKDNLSSGTTQSAAALNEISSNITSIRNQFDALNEIVSGTTRSILSIGSRISDIRSGIERQSASVSETSSSIEEMTAGIRNVVQLSDERQKRSSDLVAIIRNGGEKVEAANTAIRQISREVDDILEIIDIINGVAEQTNLLSMNAAIESAHAGEAGKGFGVVAEEIRKLAESTSENAARVAQSLKSITGKIETALSASDKSFRSFEELSGDVYSFTDAMAEISSGMNDLMLAGGTVLKATQRVTDITREIRERAVRIDEDSGSILDSMKAAENISLKAADGIGEIDNGAREILGSLEDVRRMSIESRESMEELSSVVGSFKTVNGETVRESSGDDAELTPVRDPEKTGDAELQ